MEWVKVPSFLGFWSCTIKYSWKKQQSCMLTPAYTCRVLARISKMPVQNINSKISAWPDLATYQLYILILTTFNSLLCQKGHFTLQLCPRRWFVSKITWLLPPKSKNWKLFIEIFACPKRRFSGNCISKRQAGWVLAKSLDWAHCPQEYILDHLPWWVLLSPVLHEFLLQLQDFLPKMEKNCYQWIFHFFLLILLNIAAV